MRRAQAFEQQLDLAAEQVGHGGRAAPVGHVHVVDLGHVAEQLGRHVHGRAVTGGAVAQLAGLALREREQLFHRMHRQALVDQQHARALGHEDHRLQVFRGVVAQVVVELHGAVVRDGGEHQRVAICRALGHAFGAGVAAGARLVLDHHRLTQARRQAFAHHAREHVGRAAGGVGHHQLHGARGIRILREGGQGERAQAQGQQRAVEVSFFHVACLRLFWL